MKPGPTVTGLIVGLLVLSVVFYGIERVLGRRRGKPWLRPGWFLDLGYWFFTPLATHALTRFVLIVPARALVILGLSAQVCQRLVKGAFFPIEQPGVGGILRFGSILEFCHGRFLAHGANVDKLQRSSGLTLDSMLFGGRFPAD